MKKISIFLWLVFIGLIVALGAMFLWASVVFFVTSLWLLGLFMFVAFVMCSAIAITVWELINTHSKFPDDWSKKNEKDK